MLSRYAHGHRSALVCFHHAGGGSSAFRGWAGELAPHLDVVLVQLKGREDRAAEPLTDVILGDLAVEIAQRICALPYDDIVLLGHSMGATVAWAVADAIWAVYRRRVRVVLSAQAPPPYTSRIGAWSPREVRGAATVDGGGAADAFHADLLAADLAWMSREFPTLVPRSLPVDLYCVSADQDHLVAPDAMAGWASLTTRHFSQLTVSGGHMYLLADPAPLLGLVTELAAQSPTDGTDRGAIVVH
ncbi:alpha/beta fold hydrolase [Streptomyces sp. NBC_01381]|uniref:thioesterase II family protein n=1 Tax=Streptomyces sp. NBC_01381 TaxID=2903845 RepID=UPI00225B74E9|nr:alpha/beta fold hydrolase [Streptomyces sp. NBC_01381]MCX4671229.1 alpha/beta fold hydrolase [Streptomyces sp. NBC_01381]